MLRLEARAMGRMSWIRIVCGRTGTPLREWRGSRALQILERAFPGAGLLERFSSARKQAIRRVHLAATGLALGDNPPRARSRCTGYGQEEARTGRDHDMQCGLLQRHGLRCTRQRLAVARCLFEKRQHLSAPELLRRLRERGCRCSRATVYNTLNLFADHGLVRPVVVDGTRVFYDTVTTPHPHLYRTDTGTLEDLDAALLEPLRHLPLPKGLVTEAIDVVVKARARA